MRLLIDDWRQAWRMWSVRFSFMGLLTQFLAFTDWPSVLATFNMMPAPLREVLTPEIHLGLSAFFFSAALAARMIRQPKLEAKRNDA